MYNFHNESARLLSSGYSEDKFVFPCVLFEFQIVSNLRQFTKSIPGTKTWDREQHTSLPINTDYASRAQGDFYRVLTTRTTKGRLLY